MIIATITDCYDPKDNSNTFILEVLEVKNIISPTSIAVGQSN